MRYTPVSCSAPMHCVLTPSYSVPRHCTFTAAPALLPVLQYDKGMVTAEEVAKLKVKMLSQLAA